MNISYGKVVFLYLTLWLHSHLHMRISVIRTWLGHCVHIFLCHHLILTLGCWNPFRELNPKADEALWLWLPKFPPKPLPKAAADEAAPETECPEPLNEAAWLLAWLPLNPLEKKNNIFHYFICYTSILWDFCMNSLFSISCYFKLNAIQVICFYIFNECVCQVLKYSTRYGKFLVVIIIFLNLV